LCPLRGFGAALLTHYSAPELEELIEAAYRVCKGKSGKTPALVVLRHRTLSAVTRLAIGKKGVVPET
jgi:hypothetical protein